MAWKSRRNNKDKMTTTGSVSSSGNSLLVTTKRLPLKSCLRRMGDSVDSDFNSVASSSISSHRSETYRSENSSSRGSNTSEPLRHSSQQAGVRSDGAVSAQVGGVVESSCSARGNRSIGSSQATAHRSIGSTSSSQISKGVKFSVVEIRDYEREVGDNPSCSNGPPIGIGWSHLDSRVVHVNHYEISRPYRKGQLEMVLTREEREAILAEWGISSREVKNSIRALNKAKDQRRQTVRNLDKAQRVEEGIESASRKLKRLLTLTPSTSSKVKELQQQAEIAASQSPIRFDSSPPTGEDGLDREQRPDRRSSSLYPTPEINERQGGIIDEVEIKYPSSGAVEAKIDGDNSKAATTSTSAGSADEPDTISCISGLSLGNSTTPSTREIERFYRELEIEMFGDQELPSMVGQTLEVDVDIPEEEKVFHDLASHCCSSEPPSVAVDTHGDGSNQPSHQQYFNETFSMPHPQTNPVQTPHGGQHALSPNTPIQYTYSYQAPAQFPSPAPAHAGFPNGQVRRDFHSNLPNYPLQSRLADCVPYARASTMRRDWNCTTDGPPVMHTPLASLSPSLMEGEGLARRGTPRSAWEAVTISEENSADAEIDQHFVDHSPRHILPIIR